MPTQCSTVEKYNAVLLIAMCFIMAITVAYAMYRFIKTFRDTTCKTISTTGKVVGIIFQISTISALMTFWAWIPSTVLCCPSLVLIQGKGGVIMIVYALFYSMQTCTLMIIYFDIIQSIFSSHEFQVTSATRRLYNTIFSLFALCTVIAVFVYTMSLLDVWLFFMLIVLYLVLYWICFVSLVILFMYKLTRVYKSLQYEDNQFLIKPMTKVTILASVSLSCTFANLVWFAVCLQTDPLALERIGDWIALLDIFSNFLCVTMSYKAFKNVYVKMCGFADTRCDAYWTQKLKEDVKTQSMQALNTLEMEKSMDGEEIKADPQNI
eukprot:248475_1